MFYVIPYTHTAMRNRIKWGDALGEDGTAGGRNPSEVQGQRHGGVWSRSPRRCNIMTSKTGFCALAYLVVFYR